LSVVCFISCSNSFILTLFSSISFI
jgi:hypothetical protein